MNKCIYNGIDIFNPLAGNMKCFIDAFTTIYGEKYRPVIEKRLTNAKYFFLGGNFDFIIEAYKQRQKQEIERVKSYNITKNLKKLKIKEITERYQLIINVFEKSKAKSEEITTRYQKARFKLVEQELQTLQQKKMFKKLSTASPRDNVNTWLEILNLGEQKLKSNQILLTEQKQTQYIALFNAMGYKAKNFEAYLKNKKLMSNLFNPQLVVTLKHWEKTEEDEQNKANICTADMIKQLNALEIYGGSDAYVQLGTEYITGNSPNSAFAVSCLSKNSSFTSLCFCKNGINLNIEDLTHEMGHIIDSFVVQSSQHGFYHKCGFETHYFPLTTQGSIFSNAPAPDSPDYRLFELFNEMINEYICLQVAEEVKKSGKTIVFGERRGKSKYQFGFEIFEDFLKKYKNKLIEFKMKVDKQDAAQQYFGEQNLKALAVLTKQYIEKRCELNLKLCNHIPGAAEEIETLQKQSKLLLAAIEKNIEKHINQNNTLESPQTQPSTESTLPQELSA